MKSERESERAERQAVTEKVKSFGLTQNSFYLCQFFGGELLVGAGSEVFFELRYGAGSDDD